MEDCIQCECSLRAEKICKSGYPCLNLYNQTVNTFNSFYNESQSGHSTMFDPVDYQTRTVLNILDVIMAEFPKSIPMAMGNRAFNVDDFDPKVTVSPYKKFYQTTTTPLLEEN